MSASEPAQPIELSITAREPLTEIMIIDSQFARVAKGVGRLSASLRPGPYTVKFKAGSVISDVDVYLVPGQPAPVIEQPALALKSAAPLEWARSGSDSTNEAAASSSSGTVIEHGRGARIVVVIRDLEGQARSNPGLGVRILEAEGTLVADLKTHGTRFTAEGREEGTGCTVEVDPGNYILESRAGDTILYLPIIAVSQWQTQLFLLRESVGSGRMRRPDLAEAAIMMARPGADFSPNDPDWVLVEQARTGLADERQVVPEDVVNMLVAGKYQNPILGILAANLLWLAPEPNVNALRAITINLRDLLGDHPDVVALELRLGIPTTEEVTFPPMLRASWSAIVAATASRPDLVPADSQAARAATSLWSAGAWLIWRDEVPTAKAATKSASWTDQARQRIKLAIDAANDTYDADESSTAGSDIKASQLDIEEVTVSLGVPRSVAEQAVEAYDAN